jgi:hypothetical protein
MNIFITYTLHYIFCKQIFSKYYLYPSLGHILFLETENQLKFSQGATVYIFSRSKCCQMLAESINILKINIFVGTQKMHPQRYPSGTLMLPLVPSNVREG